MNKKSTFPERHWNSFNWSIFQESFLQKICLNLEKWYLGQPKDTAFSTHSAFPMMRWKLFPHQSFMSQGQPLSWLLSQVRMCSIRWPVSANRLQQKNTPSKPVKKRSSKKLNKLKTPSVIPNNYVQWLKRNFIKIWNLWFPFQSADAPSMNTTESSCKESLSFITPSTCYQLTIIKENQAQLWLLRFGCPMTRKALSWPMCLL